MSRLTIEIEPEQHRQIKTLATFSGMSMKEYILSKALPRKPTADETEVLLGDPANAARLREALSEPEDTHRVFETVEDLRNALGI